jgi:hypothetical protein
MIAPLKSILANLEGDTRTADQNVTILQPLDPSRFELS